MFFNEKKPVECCREYHANKTVINIRHYVTKLRQLTVSCTSQNMRDQHEFYNVPLLVLITQFSPFPH